MFQTELPHIFVHNVNGLETASPAIKKNINNIGQRPKKQCCSSYIQNCHSDTVYQIYGIICYLHVQYNKFDTAILILCIKIYGISC